MSSETISDLRSHLFAALRGLTDTKNPMEIERARAVSDIAQTIINSAKVEVDAIRIAGGQGSGFFPALADPDTPQSSPGPSDVIEQRPGVTVRRHVLK